ncbi:MAG: SPOR domain-containing protein [Albidovulum sp.]|uniref:SPOR domain-containing protein n=1 Tax=Albidovulum sp. TaxID=1872424 RepID=UPI003CB6CC96
MRAIRTTVAAVFAVNFLIGQAGAEILVPAETPPADFSGNQYIDSAGCVFMRGEIGGHVAWLPRLNRDRQQVCGYDPTFATAALPEVMPEPEPDETPTVAEPPAEDAEPKPDAQTAALPAPAETQRRKTSDGGSGVGTPPFFVQVGAFAVGANADRVADRILAMGLPVTIVRERLGARPIRSVLTGPFEDEAAYRDAIRRVREAGFADAFRRRQPVQMP